MTADRRSIGRDLEPAVPHVARAPASESEGRRRARARARGRPASRMKSRSVVLVRPRNPRPRQGRDDVVSFASTPRASRRSSFGPRGGKGRTRRTDDGDG